MARVIEVINWEKFNPRTDYRCHWFRLESDILTNPNVPFLDGDEFKVFIYILCTTCRCQGKPWILDIERIKREIVVKKQQILSCITKLEQFQIVQSTEQIRSDPFVHNITEHNEHNEQYSSFDFEIIYDAYPRKQGKSRGIKKCESLIKTQSHYDELLKAVNNYANHCAANNIQIKFIKLFSTFMGEWVDWVEPITECAKSRDVLEILEEYENEKDSL